MTAALALALVACDRSTTPASGYGTATQFPATAAGCNGIYGSEPRTLAGTVDPANNQKLCDQLSGQVLNWTDADGTPRRACLATPNGIKPSKPLPLVVWLHESGGDTDSISNTNITDLMLTEDLSGDPARQGFVLLLPQGRNIHLLLPFPDTEGQGWDTWYRNFDRHDPKMNVDFATIDHFIAMAKQQGIVDSKRVYISGWSNGAVMASEYSLNTQGIAATGIYSGGTPYTDPDDPCPQVPFASNHPAVYQVHPACDVIGNCYLIENFMGPQGELLTHHLSNVVQDRIIDNFSQATNSCDASCSALPIAGYPPLGTTIGLYNHATWPDAWTSELLTFMRDHPLQ